MTSTIYFAVATSLAAAGTAISLSMQDTNQIMTIVSIAATGLGILLTIVTGIVSFVTKLKESIKEAKKEDSDGGSKVTQAEMMSAIKSALEIAQKSKKEADAQIESLKALSDKIEVKEEEKTAEEEVLQAIASENEIKQ